jgi:glycosyltransferase involved in cell wall biosynthesis
MAAGTPVITSNATMLVSPHSTEDIAAAIVRLVKSPELREQHRRAGLENARRFSWDRAAQETLEILQRFAPELSEGRR